MTWYPQWLYVLYGRTCDWEYCLVSKCHWCKEWQWVMLNLADIREILYFAIIACAIYICTPCRFRYYTSQANCTIHNVKALGCSSDLNEAIKEFTFLALPTFCMEQTNFNSSWLARFMVVASKMIESNTSKPRRQSTSNRNSSNTVHTLVCSLLLLLKHYLTWWATWHPSHLKWRFQLPNSPHFITWRKYLILSSIGHTECV